MLEVVEEKNIRSKIEDTGNIMTGKRERERERDGGRE